MPLPSRVLVQEVITPSEYGRLRGSPTISFISIPFFFARTARYVQVQCNSFFLQSVRREQRLPRSIRLESHHLRNTAVVTAKLATSTISQNHRCRQTRTKYSGAQMAPTPLTNYSTVCIVLYTNFKSSALPCILTLGTRETGLEVAGRKDPQQRRRPRGGLAKIRTGASRT